MAPLRRCRVDTWPMAAATAVTMEGLHHALGRREADLGIYRCRADRALPQKRSVRSRNRAAEDGQRESALARSGLQMLKKFLRGVEPDMDFLVVTTRVEAGMTPHPPTVPDLPAN
jgi:hypothetical protein